MQWIIWGLLILCSTTDFASTQNETGDVQELFRQLQDAPTSDQAYAQLLELGTASSSAREYISMHLPALIDEKTSGGPIWLNAVRLAGGLKISTAVPALVSSLNRIGPKGTVTYTTHLHLNDDPAAKALAKIGDAAVSAVAEILQRDDAGMRSRAALILVNTDSPDARRALRQHLATEQDPKLKDFIRREVGQER